MTVYVTRTRDGVEKVLGHAAVPGRVSEGNVVRIGVEISGTSPVRLKASAWVGEGNTPPNWQVAVEDSSSERIASGDALEAIGYLSASAQSNAVLQYQQFSLVEDSPNPPPSPEEPTTPNGRASANAGSAQIGSASYPVPTGAVFVSPSGNDSASGSQANPVRTIARGVDLAPTGGTVVIRGGTYHENVPIYDRITVQNYPGEAVWMDGTTTVTGWQKSGSIWVKTGWKPRFDSTPGFSAGDRDGSGAFRFLDPAYPMAAHPDQVFVDGAPLQQVSSIAEVGSGSFYLDEKASNLYVGANPTGREVRASGLPKAISVRADGVVLRGIGMRRYATSLPLMGTVTLERANAVVENVVIRDNASIGLGVYAKGATVTRVTASKNGLLGIAVTGGYGLKLVSSLVSENNAEKFNMAPSAGGVKIGRSRGLVVRDNRFVNNRGTGLWFDESCYDSMVTGNEMTGNGNHGMSYEISSTGVFANNLVRNNQGNGFKINNADNLDIWNNTLLGNGRPINLVQDARRQSDPRGSGKDPQRPDPDPTVPWLLKNIRVHNNVVRHGTGNCMVCVEDYSEKVAADAMGISLRGNLYNRPSGAPSWFAIWSRTPTTNVTYTNLSTFRNAIGQESGSALFDNSRVVNDDGSITDSARSTVGPAALTSKIASQVGKPSGAVWAGAWLN